MSTPGSLLSADVLRDAVRARAARTSLRATARETGVSAPGLLGFLGGAHPQEPTLERLREWYVRLHAAEERPATPESGDGALHLLTRHMVPVARGRARRRVLEVIAGAGSEPPPAWVADLLASLPPDPPRSR